VARRLLGGGGRDYWKYQNMQLALFGYRLRIRDVAAGVVTEAAYWLSDAEHAMASRAKLADKLRRQVERPARAIAQAARRALLVRHRLLRRRFYDAVTGGRRLAERVERIQPPSSVSAAAISLMSLLTTA
jgi:hypothetical protein